MLLATKHNVKLEHVISIDVRQTLLTSIAADIAAEIDKEIIDDMLDQYSKRFWVKSFKTCVYGNTKQ